MSWIGCKHTHSTPLGPPSHPHPHPTPAGHHRALGCGPCVIEQLPASHLFECTNVSALSQSIPPTLSPAVLSWSSIPYEPDPELGMQRGIHRDKIYRAKSHRLSAHDDAMLSERQVCKEQLHFPKIKARMKIHSMFIRAWRGAFFLVLSFSAEGLVRNWTGGRQCRHGARRDSGNGVWKKTECRTVTEVQCVWET